MPELRADLDLALDQAIASLSELDDAFGDAASRFSDQLAEAVAAVSAVPIEVDTSAAEAAIADLATTAEDTAPEIPIDADISAAESAIADVAASAESAAPAIQIDADTTEAEQALEGLESQAEAAGESVEMLGGAAGGFRAVSDLATGSAQGLGDALTSTGGAAAKVVGSVAAGAAAVGVFFNAAVETEGAVERFERTLGRFAGQVDHINVGSLNTDIAELALTLGSSSVEMRTAATNAFLFAENSGVAREDAALFSEQLLALSARAVALNPNLGDAGQAAQNLQRALASGRDRALIPFNLGLDKTQIAARAAELALAAGRTEVTSIDKAMAGAQLATEKFGGSLGKDIAEGAQNPVIQLRRLKTELKEYAATLGAPLVAPIFELLEAGLPVAQRAGDIIARLATAALPLLTAALDAALPILTIISDVLEALPAPILSTGLAFMALARFTGISAAAVGTAVSSVGLAGGAARASVLGLGLALAAILPILSAIGPEVASGATQVGLFALAGAQLGKVIPGLTPGIGAAAGATIGLGQAIGGTAGNMLSGAAAGAALGSVIPGVGTAAGAAVGAVLALGASFLGGGESAKEYSKRIGEVTEELIGLSKIQAAKRFLAQIGEGFDIAEHGTESFRDDFKQMAKELEDLARGGPAQAVSVLEGLGSQGILTAAEMRTLRQAVDEGSEAYAKHAAKAELDADANRDVADSADGTVASLLLYQETLDAFVQTATAALPTIPGIFQAARAEAEKLGQALSPEALIASFQGAITAMQTFNTSMATILGLGFEEVGALIASQGPFIGGQFATAFLAAPPAVQAALDGIITGTRTVTDETVAMLETVFGPQIVQAFLNATAPLPPAGEDVGREATKGVEKGMGEGAANAPAKATELARDALDKKTRQVLKAAAYDAGHDAGRRLGQGIADGIDSKDAVIRKAAKDAVRAAIAAAKNAGSPSEHLFHDAGAAQMGAYAEGLTAAGTQAVAAAEAIVRDAASTLVGPTGASSSATRSVRIAIDISVSGDGATSPEELAAVERGARATLGATLRDVVVLAGTG